VSAFRDQHGPAASTTPSSLLPAAAASAAALWLRTADKSDALEWIEKLEASGSTCLGPAMSAATSLADVTDIVTLCDGGLDDKHSLDFPSVARRFPNVRFHFVAVGSDADTKMMEEMAMQGRGHYQYEL
jgi:hypothetical protein